MPHGNFRRCRHNTRSARPSSTVTTRAVSGHGNVGSRPSGRNVNVRNGSARNGKPVGWTMFSMRHVAIKVSDSTPLRLVLTSMPERVDQVAGGSYDWDSMSGNDLIHVFYKYAAEPETVVKIETIVELDDKEIMGNILSDHLNGIYGGWEILQSANPNKGVKGKRVAKVVMFRSEHYCFFGNPMGDLCTIVDYYVPVNCADMFSDLLHVIAEENRRKMEDEQRLAAERRAKLKAEQEPLIAEWERQADYYLCRSHGRREGSCGGEQPEKDA